MLTVLILGNLTALSQDSLGGKWYTLEQRKQCIKCLMNEPIKDSIIAIRETQVIELKEAFDGCSAVVNDQRIQLMVKDDEINKLRRHRKALLGVSGGLLGLILVVFLITP